MAQQPSVQSLRERGGLGLFAKTQHHRGGDTAEIQPGGCFFLVADQGNGPVVDQRAQTDPAPFEHDHGRETFHTGGLPAAVLRCFP